MSAAVRFMLGGSRRVAADMSSGVVSCVVTVFVRFVFWRCRRMAADPALTVQFYSEEHNYILGADGELVSYEITQ